MKNNRLLQKILFLILLYVFSGFVISLGVAYEVKELPEWGYLNLVLLAFFMPLFCKYLVHLSVVPWYPLINKRQTSKGEKNYKPKVSVIVPAWNEEVGIVSTIKSILSNDYDNFELIVVNDGSTDRTDEKVKKFINKYNGGTPVLYVEKSNGGKASALNLGVEKSKGEIIITTDADSNLDKYAIQNIVKQFSDSRVMAVAGNVRVGNTGRIIGAIQKIEYIYGFYFKRADSILNSVYIVGGAAAAYRKEIFNKLGYFDTEIITEDIEYSTRILNAGYTIRYATDAVFYTEVPSDMGSLIKQRLRWKFGRLMTFYKHRDLFFRVSGDQSKFLSFLIFPTALFTDILLFFYLVFLPTFYVYISISRNFTPLIVLMLFLTVVILLQILTDSKRAENKEASLWAPVAWLVLYFIVFVEHIALMKSISKIIKKKSVEWQKCRRIGVFEK